MNAPAILLFFLLLLTGGSPLGAQSPTPSDIVAGLAADQVAAYQTLSLGDFRLHFHAVDRHYAQHVATVVRASEERLTNELGLRGLRGSQIVVAFDPPHFYRLAGAGTPHWAGAVANPEARLIVLKSPRWGDARDDAGATIRHEMTHLAVGRITRGHGLPVWMEEGLAVHMSGLPLSTNPDMGQLSLSKALFTGSLPPLERLDGLHGFGSQNAELAYQQADSAVEFFLERHGRVALLHLLTEVGRGTGFREAFDRATGGGYYRFEADWRTWLKKRSGLYFLVDASSWIWAGIVLLAVVAFWLRRRRARKTLERWRREEAEEDEGFLD